MKNIPCIFIKSFIINKTGNKFAIEILDDTDTATGIYFIYIYFIYFIYILYLYLCACLDLDFYCIPCKDLEAQENVPEWIVPKHFRVGALRVILFCSVLYILGYNYSNFMKKNIKLKRKKTHILRVHKIKWGCGRETNGFLY